MPTDSGITTSDTALPTLNDNGQPPESRITSAVNCRNLTIQWLNNDNMGRSQKRARVDGLLQGNVPYSRGALTEAGRRDACNVNFRTAEAFEDSAKGALYDLFSESPTFATVDLYDDPSDPLSDLDPNTVIEWSQIVTEEFDYLLKSDRSFDSVMQNSIRETVRFGSGPLVFCDDTDWRNRNVPFAYLQLPDDASSDVNKWEVAAVRVDYLPHQLYDYIRSPDSASEVGWNVSATRQSILHAAADIQSSGIALTWEWAQQQLKQDSFSFSARSKIIQAVHFFAREFPRPGDPPEGKISHVIFVLNIQSGDTGDHFLYKALHKYDRWQQCIHPMYYSQGEGGKHYGVTGMGVKMYGAMEIQNRMLCNMVDKAFAPKIMFRPTSASGGQKAMPTRHGDYMLLPAGYDLQQMSIGSMIEEGIVLNREISGLVSSNLSTYRQNLEAPKSGNPLTKAEVEIRAQDQARLSKTQHNRYYEQLDWLYEEKYRRASNPNLTASDPGGPEALEFQKCCKDRGVPEKMLQRFRSVKATRVVGQGSQYLRTQTLDFFIGLAGALPEEGREHVIKDAIAARAGQYMVQRYYPSRSGGGYNSQTGPLASDQLAEAWQMVAVMKTRIPAVITSSQNPMIFAQTFMQASSQALESMAQAGNSPQDLITQGSEVLAFLQLSGPATAAHLQRMSADPTRKAALPALTKQFQQIASLTDKLRQKVQSAITAQQRATQERQQKQMAAGAEALAVANGQDPALIVGLAGVDRNARIKAAKESSNFKLKAEKQSLDSRLKTTKAAQDMALDDLTTANEIELAAAESAAKRAAVESNGKKSP